ncbi:hypothetical protein Cgig2_007018 [Carnegiea gigantea]|uniref:Uncharacterized protein n=1 Tax=Carnegiea gigantea TaxID=171969 RepID=A0A9Q1QFC6_9CARY|nr:hypothetical protein Cgig2_007018 [Carnegiea gigantea]
MGNCQAVDAAALVIQHPSGKVERMYWPVKANEVMKMNPGHYVFLIIPLSLSDSERALSDQKKAVRYTRVKLLRPSDTLILGHAYRLVTSQEVKKVLKAKKLAKGKMKDLGLGTDKLQMNRREQPESEENNEAPKQDRQKLRSGSMNSRSKTWRPSLQSISEAAS